MHQSFPSLWDLNWEESISWNPRIFIDLRPQGLNLRREVAEQMSLSVSISASSNQRSCFILNFHLRVLQKRSPTQKQRKSWKLLYWWFWRCTWEKKAICMCCQMVGIWFSGPELVLCWHSYFVPSMSEWAEPLQFYFSLFLTPASLFPLFFLSFSLLRFLVGRKRVAPVRHRGK